MMIVSRRGVIVRPMIDGLFDCRRIRMMSRHRALKADAV
jgi:hypothetical protein